MNSATKRLAGRTCVAIAPLFLAALACAQFEAVSIKLSNPAASGITGAELGGPGTGDPTFLRFVRVSMTQLVMRAFDVREDAIAGPKWISEQRYDIEARLPAGTAASELPAMLRKLLRDRFDLSYRVEERKVTGYELTSSDHLKIHETGESDPKDAVPGELANLPADRDGFPILPAGIRGTSMRFGPGGLTYSRSVGVSMPELASRIGIELGGMSIRNSARVMDQTGLRGRYDFNLVYNMALPASAIPVPNAEPGHIGIDAAIEQQLGLRLRKTTLLTPYIALDRVNRNPSDN